VLRAKYAANAGSAGQLPALALSAEQCAALAGRLRACVLEPKGAAPPTPIRKNSLQFSKFPECLFAVLRASDR
jgi:hypothetical protein